MKTCRRHAARNRVSELGIRPCVGKLFSASFTVNFVHETGGKRGRNLPLRRNVNTSKVVRPIDVCAQPVRRRDRWPRGHTPSPVIRNMAEPRAVNLSSVATAAAVMTVIGALDGLVDEPITPKVVRAGWKTLLGAAGLYLNVTNFLAPGSRCVTSPAAGWCVRRSADLPLFTGSRTTPTSRSILHL